MRHLFRRAAPSNESLAEDAAVLGIDLSDQEDTKDQAFELWAELGTVFALFEFCLGSWRTSATGLLIGLDKSDVKANADMLGIQMNRKMLHDLMVCETEYIKIANKRRPKGGR